MTAENPFDPISVAFRQYKYILANVRLISCSLSTYNNIIIVLHPLSYQKKLQL